MDCTATPQSARPRLALDLKALVPLRLRPLLAIVPQLSRYTLVSGLALLLDFAVYLLIAAGGSRLVVAGVAGYACGLMFHYLLSVRFVFDPLSAGKPQARLLTEFAVSGLVGMAITALVIALAADLGGLPLLPAKALAACASFLVVFALRRSVVFAPSRRV